MSDPPRRPAAAPGGLAYISATDVDGLSVADVMHAGVASLPSTATVGELRDWFAAGRSRRLAVIADHDRYAGAVTPSDVGPAVGDDEPALEVAREHATLSPELPAADGRDRVAGAEGRRLPVVDDDGRFLGVLALTTDLQFFACRAAPAPG